MKVGINFDPERRTIGDWKVEDITISNITIKDLEFTKPTMNARETITVESMKNPPVKWRRLNPRG